MNLPQPRADAGARPLFSVTGVIVLLLIGLPFAVWLDLRELSERNLRAQASDLNRVFEAIRGYYGRNVVARVLGSTEPTKVVHNYTEHPGAIPIPATMSLELGKAISDQDANVTYRFVSDLPFRRRPPHALDAFERSALAELRANADHPILQASGSLFDRQVRIAAPVKMGQACVSCHNAHPESPRHDWKVGDVRGIQEIVIRQTIAANIFSFKFLLIYLVAAVAVGVAFILMQRRQNALIGGMNKDLTEANDFLAGISMKIAKYLSPQVYKSIFSGQKDVVIATERKKLTIFFSDIKDFTATTERLQPEDLTALLNEYFTEMAAIAQEYGGTIDKFIGDAMLVFFGDPETKGVVEDAKACLRMAIEMQRRMAELNARWRERGIERPFRTRMGINTGFCNVGNFGSADRMDYTIIGAEANLAARLQSIAEPGGIVMSYETHALVRDFVGARPLPAITMKGISREVIPYAVEGFIGEDGQRAEIVSEHVPGLDIFLDTQAISGEAAKRAKDVLKSALAALEKRELAGPAAAPPPDERILKL